MHCKTCPRPDAQRVTLIDGREVCSWCDDWRHECEARAVLAFPALKQRRQYLYGKPDHFGNMKGGIKQLRGDAELKRMESTMTAIWKKNNSR